MTALRGSIAALPTPFRRDDVDIRSLGDLVEWQIAEGSDAIAVGGATGEWPTLTATEVDILVRAAVEASARRAPVLAGIVTSSTQRAIEVGLMAKKAGADALLVTCPPYNRPTQEGLFSHFEALAAKVDLPLVVEDDPGRTRVGLNVETIRRLSDVDGIVALVDATGDPARASVIAGFGEGRLAPLSGWDATAAAFGAAGGCGCVSVLANVAPGLCAGLQRACRSGDWSGANGICARLKPLSDALTAEGHPAAVKWCLSVMRPDFAPAVRLPLVETSAEVRRHLVEALEVARILSPSAAGCPAFAAR